MLQDASTNDIHSTQYTLILTSSKIQHKTCVSYSSVMPQKFLCQNFQQAKGRGENNPTVADCIPKQIKVVNNLSGHDFISRLSVGHLRSPHCSLHCNMGTNFLHLCDNCLSFLLGHPLLQKRRHFLHQILGLFQS